MAVHVEDRDAWGDLAAVVAEMSPGELARFKTRLPAADVERIELVEAQITEDGWRSDPAALMHALTGGEYKLWRYIRFLARKFAGAVTGSENPHQIWNLPSQHGKTSMVAQAIPLWLLDRDPTKRIMYVSYDADKAVEEAGKARDLAEHHPEHLRFRLRRDMRARGMWRTEQGGGLYAVGINGSITGWPVDVLLMDDLIKGWQAAHSAANREFVWNIWRSQLRLRLQGFDCPVIDAGTRWHEDDIHARLQKAAEDEADAFQFETIRLPATAEEDDPIGRVPGEILEPERFDEREVRSRKATLGTYLWTAMEQQRPSPEEGGEIQRSWWRWTTSTPPRFDDVAASWDMKLKDKEAGDYCVGQVWGRTGSSFWLVDQMRGQWSTAATRIAAVVLLVRHPEIRRHFIESAGFGPEVIELLREPDPAYELSDEMCDLLGIMLDERPKVEAQLHRGVSGIIGVQPKGPKTVRARAVSGKIEAGNVFLPEGKDFAEQLVDECAGFPNAAHDDAVDAMSQALSRMARMHGSIKTASGSIARQVPKRRN